jgi:hypothetical protein
MLQVFIREVCATLCITLVVERVALLRLL